MDLFRLNDSSHQPEVVIEGYSSLIWTERYSDLGDFNLKTGMVDETEALLPKGAFVSILQSDEVMLVETHLVTTDDAGAETLTVTGRTFPSILESRAMVYNDDPVSADYYNGQPGVFIVNLINTKIASTTEPGVLQADLPAEGILHSFAKDYSADTTELPEQPFADPTPGDVMSVVSSVLKQYDLGIKTTRPEADKEDLVIGVYTGLDRTYNDNPGSVDDVTEIDFTKQVVFDFEVGDIVDYSYISSIKDYRNVAYVRAPIGFLMVYAPGTPSNVSGKDRRVLQVDATDLTDEGNLTVEQALIARGLKELAKHNNTSLLDGELSEDSDYIYGVHYNLGDKISLLGKAGVANTRRVTEYVRSEDESGEEKAYPTLAEVEDS